MYFKTETCFWKLLSNIVLKKTKKKKIHLTPPWSSNEKKTKDSIIVFNLSINMIATFFKKINNNKSNRKYKWTSTTIKRTKRVTVSKV